MSKLLFEIENYRGEGIAAALFYETKVTEAIALVADDQKKQAAKNMHPLSRLAGIACMSVYSRQAHESGGTSAYRYRFHYGSDRADDRLHHFEPLCRAVQKEHGNTADRISQNSAEKSIIRGCVPLSQKAVVL